MHITTLLPPLCGGMVCGGLILVMVLMVALLRVSASADRSQEAMLAAMLAEDAVAEQNGGDIA